MKSQFWKQALMAIAAGVIVLLAEGAYCQEIRVGLINADRVLRESAPAKVIAAKLDAEFNSREMELERATARKDSDVDCMLASYLAEQNQRRNEELAKVIGLMNAAMKAVAEEEKYGIVVQESLPYSSKRVVAENITQKMIDRLGKPAVGR